MSIGIMFRCQNPPEALPDFARCTESFGFDELWIIEDCFFNGGISASAVALAVTQNITVGLGIMPAVARNAAFVAMEIATLARIYPGRFHAGFGHGVADWMRQVGAFPSSQLGAIREVTHAVRALLHGDRVSASGSQVNLRDVELVHKPSPAPMISLGVRGGKSLKLSGEEADGTIIPECSSPAYVRWVREQIQPTRPHRLTVYAFCCVDNNRQTAFSRLRPLLAQLFTGGDYQAQLAPMGIADEVKTMVERGTLATEMPESWIEELAGVGTPSECRAYVQHLFDAGADSVVLVPLFDQPGDSLEAMASVLTAI